MNILAIVPLSPRAGNSTLGANFAGYWALENARTGFLDLSDTAVAWTGLPEGMQIVPSMPVRSLIEDGQIEELYKSLLAYKLDRLIVALPYSKESYLCAFLQFDPDLVLLARLETAFSRSMNEFLDMAGKVREVSGGLARITGLMLKLATRGPVTDTMLGTMRQVFDSDLVFAAIPHVKELAESEISLLVSRQEMPPIAPLIRDTAARLFRSGHDQSPKPEFPALLRAANRLGAHLPGWISRAREQNLEVVQTAEAGQSTNEIIDELAAEIEQLQKDLSEARKIHEILEKQIAELEATPGSGPESDSKDFFAQTADLTVEVNRLKNLLDMALSDSEQLMRERNALREEIERTKSQPTEAALEISEVETPPAADIEELARLAREKEDAVAKATRLEAEISRYESFREQIEELRTALSNQVEERTLLEQKYAAETGRLRQELEDSRQRHDTELSDYRQRLSQDMAAVSSKLSDGLAQVQQIKAERDALQGEVTRLTGELSRRQDTEPQTGPESSQLQSENDDLRRRIAETEMHLQGYKAERDSLEEKSSRLLRQIEELQREAAAPRSSSAEENLQAEADRFKNRLTETEMHLQGFRAERDQLADQLAALSSELARLKSAPPEVPVEIELDPDGALRQEELARELGTRNNELETLRVQMNEATAKIEKLETARKVFARERNELLERLDEFRRESEDAVASAEALLSGKQELMETLRSDRDRVNSELSIRTSLYNRLKAQLNPLREALKTGLAEMPGLRTRAEQSESRVAMLEKRCRELEQQLSETPEPGEELSSQISSLKREVDESRTKLDAAEARLAEQEEQLRKEFESQATGLKDTIRLLESELDKARSAAELSAIKLQTAEKVIENKTRDFQQELANAASAAKVEISRLETALDETRAELGRVEARAGEAAAIREELEQVRIQLAASKSVADEASQNRLVLENRVRDLEKQLEEARGGGDGSRPLKYEALLRELADVREELVQMRQRAGRAAIAEKIAVERAARIAQLEAEIEELGKRQT